MTRNLSSYCRDKKKLVHALFYYSSNGTAEHNFTCMSISDLMAFPSAHFNFSLALPKIKRENRDLICNFFNDYLVSIHFLFFKQKMRFKPKMYDNIKRQRMGHP